MSTPETTANTATVTLAAAAGTPSDAFTGIKLVACRGVDAEVCPANTCSTPAELAACTVSGLTPGAAYTLTAALVGGTGAVLSPAASQTATPLHS